MSGWDEYRDYMLAGGKTSEATIWDLQTGQLLSSNVLSENKKYTIKLPTDADPEKEEDYEVDEITNLLQAIGNSGIPKARCGIRINNVKYFSVNFDEERRTWYLKRHGGGACLVFTYKAILFASWDQEKKQEDGTPQNPGDCNKVVETLGQQLIQAQY
ncbi:Profilin [Pseudocohnilembus persalinus]|uniref:Profilin n=1 Tax=Pseudocohnilembus persalinus TaxID=266149 RepID=A0A0V0QSG2_PSEPJ|nr:Profilin [Pseudocohnilembus persalinus]|eukprot:KRX05156.1 Profilin [Pseudocohnilembus persalinus]